MTNRPSNAELETIKRYLRYAYENGQIQSGLSVLDDYAVTILDIFQAHQQELDQARELLQSDLQKFNELWTVWGVEHGIDFNMEAIENYFQRKIGSLK